jgi:hypothetical protein
MIAAATIFFTYSSFLKFTGSCLYRRMANRGGMVG